MMFLILLGFACLGAIWGSFVGVLSERAYTGQSWRTGRSRCNSCTEDLSGRDLVPVFSWLIHKGRCRMCNAKVPGAYAVYEFSLALLFALGYLSFSFTPLLIVYLIFIVVLAFIVIYDLRHTIVPLPASGILIALSLVFTYLASGISHAFFLNLFTSGCIALFFFLLYALSKGRAMGLGDTPVAFALSLFAGTHALQGFLFSFWIGAVIGVGILVFGRRGPKMGIEVPFVPFLALGYLLAFFTQWNPLPF